MKVSVIVPVYNGGRYLAACLDALAGQTLGEECEILCVDDGSTDNSAGILEEYRGRYPERFRIFHKENEGVYKAREFALERAGGEYIGFCDCDDVVEKQMYEALYLCASDAQAEMAVCAYERIDALTGKQLCEEMRQFGNELMQVEEHWERLAVVNTSLWNKLLRRDVAERHVRLEHAPRVAEDMMFLLSIYPHVKRIAFCDRVLYHYYVREGSAISSVKQEELSTLKESMLHTREQVKKSCEEQDITNIAAWSDVVKLFAFIHFGIVLVLKAGVGRKKQAGGLQQDIENWLDREFNGWRRNPYLSCSYVFGGHRYLLKPMIVLWMYRLRLLPMFLRMYVWLTEACKIDIKW